MKKLCHTATLSITTLDRAKYTKPVNPAPLHHLLDTNHDDAMQYVNALVKMTRTGKCNETCRFPTPQGHSDETQLTLIQKGILHEFIALEKLQQLNPQENEESRDHFVSSFEWNDSTLDKQARQALEKLLAEVHGIIARHKLDVGIDNN